MANNGIRILIERRARKRWYWQLNAYGDEHYCKRSEASPVKAAQQVEAQLRKLRKRADEIL